VLTAAIAPNRKLGEDLLALYTVCSTETLSIEKPQKNENFNVL
jgi:hypothetical protein